MVCDVNANASEKRILQRLSMCRLEMISPKAKLVGNSQVWRVLSSYLAQVVQVNK